jgi:hypothetical protein
MEDWELFEVACLGCDVLNICMQQNDSWQALVQMKRAALLLHACKCSQDSAQAQ